MRLPANSYDTFMLYVAIKDPKHGTQEDIDSGIVDLLLLVWDKSTWHMIALCNCLNDC